MNVRPPHKTDVPNSSIELFFVHNGRLAIVLTQDGTTANSTTGQFTRSHFLRLTSAARPAPSASTAVHSFLSRSTRDVIGYRDMSKPFAWRAPVR
ncbi:MAG: hypothetical protein WBK08_05610 [Nitrospira sp.]|nr:MAG: hypothetical protein E8D42_05010 [Nitrospira sp.]